MKTSDLIRTIKVVVSEASGIPNFGAKLGAAVKANPAPQGGAIFGGGTGPTAADKLRTVDRGVHDRPTRVDGMMNRTAPHQNMGSTQNISTPNGGGIGADVGRTTAPKPQTTPSTPNYNNPRRSDYISPKTEQPGRKSGPAPTQTKVAAVTKTQPSTASIPAPTQTKVAAAPKPQTSTSSAPKPTNTVRMPKPKSTSKPVGKKPISSKPMKRTWGFGSGSGSQDAGSITNRALGAVNETTKLIETIKTLTKKKNKGESPKGTPDEVIINPESGLLPPSR